MTQSCEKWGAICSLQASAGRDHHHHWANSILSTAATILSYLTKVPLVHSHNKRGKKDGFKLNFTCLRSQECCLCSQGKRVIYNSVMSKCFKIYSSQAKRLQLASLPDTTSSALKGFPAIRRNFRHDPSFIECRITTSVAWFS